MKNKNNHLKIIKEEYESKFDDYRKIDDEQMKKHSDENLVELPLYQFVQQLSLKIFLWDFDAVSLYPSAMGDGKLNYPRIETGFVFTPNMNYDLVEKFVNQSFKQGSAFLKIRYYNPKKLIPQLIPIKEKVNKFENRRMRNGYIINTLTTVDIQEIVKIGGKVVEICEGVIYRENFKISPFKKVNDKFFELRQK